MTQPPPAGSIEILLAGQSVIVLDRLTFGRDADLVIGAGDRFLHRVAGEIAQEDGHWTLHNRGSRSPLRLFASDGVHVVLPPGGRTALSAANGTISCRGGVQSYEVSYRLPNAAPHSMPSLPVGGEETATFGAPLTARETDFMLAFAEPLLTGTGERMPTYAEVAHKFGVRPKTVDTTLQRLRKKLADAGVADLASTTALVTHVLANGTITYTQLIESGAVDPAAGPG